MEINKKLPTLSPEEKAQEIAYISDSIKKTRRITAHNIGTQIARIVRKIEGGKVTVTIKNHPCPFQLRTEPYPDKKYNDLIFHKLFIKELDGRQEPEQPAEEIHPSTLFDIIDTLIKKNLH